ncbi:hypothetical protein HOM13_03875 [Candidatus Woesearchaeota archaeon]|nr:hypothetical protein [Candidatus Woesearchaeota archaeon]MBT6402376.1 hypothetical protein [Candidatus Woesearchaeota archaeon]
MTAFFDDGDGDVPGEWSGESPDAWKSKGDYSYGLEDQLNQEMHAKHVAAKTKEIDIEFMANGGRGYEILQPDMLIVCEVMDALMVNIDEKPYFIHKELSNLSKIVDDIESSKYCRFAVDQNETLAELAFYRADIATLKKQAYDKLEWSV